MNASKQMQQYFEEDEKEVNYVHKLATEARKKGYDPESRVDIPLAKGVAQRVEGLISAVSPKIMKSGVAERIVHLEKKYGSLDWRVALKISEEVAQEKFYKFESKQKAMETAVRVGLAYITLGVISAPLEGFIELRIKKRKDGKEYVSAFYAGPIRAAGGTAEAVSLVIADYVRTKMGYMSYDPTEKEVKRYISEVRDYHERVTNLQYFPSDKEIEFLTKNLSIEINGDPTEEMEVSNYKDLDRVETNRIRGGICLVLAEGLAQKAPKLHKKLRKWGKEFDLNWDFLKEFLDIQKTVKAKGKKIESKLKISPNYTYIKDLVAGRPVLSFPMKYGGLRLRYGRTRTTGLAAAAMHPQTMKVLNNYIAIGTQLKLERPGKATAIVACDTIEGPIVKLNNGSVIVLDNNSQIKIEEVKEILFLGDVLFNYGDFSENGHKLVPVGYCQEWWIREFEKATTELFGTFEVEKTSELLGVKPEHLQQLFNEPLSTKTSSRLAIKISKLFKIPLHPDYTYYWTNITKEELYNLFNWFNKAKLKQGNNKIQKIIVQTSEKEKKTLEKIGLPHLFVGKEFVVIEKEHANIVYNLFLKNKETANVVFKDTEPVLETISLLLGVTVRDKGGTFIGARMGRPEKAKMRKLSGSPHFLFPVGNEGGRLRSIQSALEQKKITADFPIFLCEKCNKETICSVCEICKSKTVKGHYCQKCGVIKNKCQHDRVYEYRNKEININNLFKTTIKDAKLNIFPDLIKGVRGTSNRSHVPEHLLKGILRSKHKVFVNKDGTTRYDMIELPVTHFQPKEIGTEVEKLKELGYTHDTKGIELTEPSQMLELKPQDQILPACLEVSDETSDEVLYRVASFVDDLLERLYKTEPYYKLNSKKDLVGHLIVGLAPHTSAGTIGRIIGFSKTQGMFSHPYYHAAMRRNCDGDESCVILLMDAFLNFSRSFLPDKRGSRTMDAPLVVTSLLVPAEVDDEVHGMDIVWQYPLELYQAAQEYKYPWEVEILQINNVLDKNEQYEGMGYTHEVSNMNSGARCSSYKIFPTMKEKLQGQMVLAEKITAVEPGQVAQLVIEKHFLKDIKGNLRKFSTQQFRCVKCNKKYRRPPLIGKCISCGGKIILTISEGSIIKYLEPTLSLATKYEVSPYLVQTLEFLNKQIESVLGREKERQEGLGKWFG